MNELRALIASAPGPAEARAQILQFIDAHPDALHRSCKPGHLTASAAVVDHERRSALLILHRKLGRWLQPGGHADGHADLAAVAWREATEETGIVGLEIVGGPIDLDVHTIPAVGSEAEHLHLDVRFVAVAPIDAEPIGNEEVAGLRWVTLEGLEDLDKSTQRLLRVALAQ